MKTPKLWTVITFVMIACLWAIVACANSQNGQNRRFEAAGSNPSSSFPSVGPTVFVDPALITGGVNDVFTISVKVFNLTDNTVPDPNWPFYQIPLGNLWSVSLNFTWDPTVLQYVSHTVTMPVETYPNGAMHDPVNIIFEELDTTAGTYHLSASGATGSTPFNNPAASNSFFEMTFTVIDVGTSALALPPTLLDLADDSMKPIGTNYAGEKIYVNIEDGLYMTAGPGDTNVYVTAKPNNQHGILYPANITAFNGSTVITSGLSNTSGIVTLPDVPYGNMIFVAYAKSDYNQVIANATVSISQEDQSFDLVCDRNYGEVSTGWRLMILCRS